MKQWIVTIPKTMKWETFQQELRAIENGDEVKNWKLRGQPKHMQPGEHMYVTHGGVLKGWLVIKSIVYRPKGVVCTTTGRQWEQGWYAQLAGRFHIVHPDPYKGFQGYRELKMEEETNAE